MSKTQSVKKLNAASWVIFTYTLILFLLLLTSININNFLQPSKVVLGAKTQESSEERFWQDFLVKNPNYVPGWIEVGRFDKAQEIDPNYLTP